ncbi:MAG: nucleotidyltransferase domain-containing protein [Gammaproteobacteria bacterium]|nr:nucleotidyltransferase domain-containing protein [Gammaproteobacteria bacterium]
MRLTQNQAEIIGNAARYMFGSTASVYLFGSRVDDAQRGGDIDLYIELPEIVPQRLEKTLRLQAELKKQLGDRKIDIIVKDAGMDEQPIHRVAKTQGIAL